MFYCDDCALKEGWRITMCKSMGECEKCGQPEMCSDHPEPEPKQKKENTDET